MVGRNLRIYGTGHPMQEDVTYTKYLDTVMIDDGLLVFHIFEEY